MQPSNEFKAGLRRWLHPQVFKQPQILSKERTYKPWQNYRSHPARAPFWLPGYCEKPINLPIQRKRLFKHWTGCGWPRIRANLWSTGNICRPVLQLGTNRPYVQPWIMEMCHNLCGLYEKPRNQTQTGSAWDVFDGAATLTGERCKRGSWRRASATIDRPLRILEFPLDEHWKYRPELNALPILEISRQLCGSYSLSVFSFRLHQDRHDCLPA